MEHNASPLNGLCMRCGRFTHEVGPVCKPEVAAENHSELLDMAWDAINALGGYAKSEAELHTSYSCDEHFDGGYVKAIGDALAAVEKLGGMDPLERKRQNRDELPDYVWRDAATPFADNH